MLCITYMEAIVKNKEGMKSIFDQIENLKKPTNEPTKENVDEYEDELKKLSVLCDLVEDEYDCYGRVKMITDPIKKWINSLHEGKVK